MSHPNYYTIVSNAWGKTRGFVVWQGFGRTLFGNIFHWKRELERCLTGVQIALEAGRTHSLDSCPQPRGDALVPKV